MNILGSYSGIGMETIDQLIEAEKAKGARFSNKKEKIEAQQGAWKDIASRLNSLQEKVNALQKSENFSSQTVRSNVKDSPFLSVSANKNAASAVYQMEVHQLASASKMTGSKIALADGSIVTSIDQELGLAGNFSFGLDDKSTSIEIQETDSLKDIANEINALTKDTDIKASIVDNRLILTSAKTGESQIELGGDLATRLGFEDPVSQFEEGKNAKLSIDGLMVERNSNKIDDVIEGLTINLTSKHAEGNSEVITVTHDTEKTVKTVKEFIEQYNSVINFISKQTDVGDPTAEKNKTGALVGESSLMRLQSDLRNLLTRNLKTSSDDKQFNLSELGIEVDRYGVATLDEAALREKVLEDPANVARAFYQPESADISGSEASASSGKAKGGMSELFKNLVESYTSKDKGIIKTKQDSYDRMLKDISKQIEVFDERIEKKRARYIAQFTALDQAMMQAESQMDYLYSQMGMDQK